MSDSTRGKKDKEKEERLDDKSTPDLLDEGFVRWAESCFVGDEQATSFVVHQLLGRHGKVEGELIRRRPVGHLKVESGVKREELVSVCNELIEEMRDEANAHRTTRMFRVAAYNTIKGGSFAQKTITVEPKWGLVKVGAGGLARRGEVDEDDVDPMGGDLLRKRTETVLQDGRFWGEQTMGAMGEMVRMLVTQVQMSNEQVNTLFRSNMEFAAQLNEAKNDELDREMLREERKLLLLAKRKGIGMLAGLLPDFLKKVTGSGGPDAPSGGGGGRSAESMVIEAIMDSQAGGLSIEEKSKVFGEWTDKGECLTPGILTPSQVKIIIGVFNERNPPSELDKLIVAGSNEQLTEKQYMQIVNTLDDMDKVMPFMKILQDRKTALDAAAATAPTNSK